MMRPLFTFFTACVFCISAALAEESSTLRPSNVGSRADRAFDAWAYQESLELYQQVPATNRTAVVYVHMGDCLYHLGRCDEAVKEYQECLEKFPKGSGRTFVYTHLADCYVVLGRLDEARQVYRMAREFYMIEFDVEARIKRLSKKSP